MTLVLKLDPAEVYTVQNEDLYTVGHPNLLKNILCYITTNTSIYTIKNKAKHCRFACLLTCKCTISWVF